LDLPDADSNIKKPTMIKNKYILMLLVFIVISFSCKKTYETTQSSVVINELMPVNSSTVQDQNGEYDDWIELFNLSSSPVDLSGYYLSDSKKEPERWQFPHGTTISANGYLIIWADNDTLQSGLHANFKLSSQGEEAVLSDTHKTIIDKTSFDAQPLELTWSRVPNGTGDFKWQSPTFNRTNNLNN
jgi:hypothetical protein